MFKEEKILHLEKKISSALPLSSMGASLVQQLTSSFPPSCLLSFFLELSHTVRKTRTDASEHYVYSRRALLTPLRLLPLPAEPETSNRVLQRYSAQNDRFL